MGTHAWSYLRSSWSLQEFCCGVLHLWMAVCRKSFQFSAVHQASTGRRRPCRHVRPVFPNSFFPPWDLRASKRLPSSRTSMSREALRWTGSTSIFWFKINFALDFKTIKVSSTFAIDHFQLFGLRQGLKMGNKFKFSGQTKIVTRFHYSLVRHPLMTGLLIMFWFTPIMTIGQFTHRTSLSWYFP